MLCTGEKVQVAAFDGRAQEADVGTVRISFGGGRFELTTRVLGFPGQCLPVLGIRDFFQRYRVSFEAASLCFFVEELRASPRH